MSNDNKIKVGDLLWHPCSIDIMEHKVVSVHNYNDDGFMQVTTKSTHNIGACGIIECLLDVRKSNIVFVELVDEDDIEYSSGLQDFIEGKYFLKYNDAQKSFYNMQSVSAYTNMANKERLYNESVKLYNKIQLIIEKLESDG